MEDIIVNMEQFVLSRFLETAVHEASHAVAAWLLGSRINEIDMRFDGVHAGMVHRCWLDDLDHTRRNQCIALAGPAGNELLRPLSKRCDVTWIDVLAERAIADNDKDWPIVSAMKSGMTEQAAKKYLTRLAKWTHELLDINEVWSVVIVLATALRPGEVMDGQVAMDIIQAEWDASVGDGGNALRVYDLGYRWCRRFAI